MPGSHPVSASKPPAPSESRDLSPKETTDLVMKVLRMRRTEIRTEVEHNTIPAWRSLSDDSRVLVMSMAIIAAEPERNRMRGLEEDLLISKKSLVRCMQVLAYKPKQSTEAAIAELESKSLVKSAGEDLHLDTGTLRNLHRLLEHRWVFDELNPRGSRPVLFAISLGYPLLNLIDRFPERDRLGRKQFGNALRKSLLEALDTKGPIVAVDFVDTFRSYAAQVPERIAPSAYASGVTAALGAAIQEMKESPRIRGAAAKPETFKDFQFFSRLRMGISPVQLVRCIRDSELIAPK